jgi:aspartate-semialdehyde dehydrogenase
MKLAIIGATGAVGQEVLHCLETLNIETEQIFLLASARSAGKNINGNIVQDLEKFDWTQVDHAINCTGSDIARDLLPKISAQGVRVIDNSSAFRYDPNIPLVVPEVNADAIGDAMIIANPNCTTAIATVALWPLHQAFGIKKIIMSTYQATSGGGAAAMTELISSTEAYLENKPFEPKKFAHNIAFNLIPHIDTFQPNGYTKEEMKVSTETHKIFGDDAIKISCTAVRIPTLRAHSEAITIETDKKIDPVLARKILSQAPGIELVDNPDENQYPMPMSVSGKFDVQVGRIRQSLVFGDNGLDLFVCGDQLLKGAALNAVQILREIM